MSSTNNASLHVTGLYYYPVKSLRGIPLEEAALAPRGISGDRMWMLSRENGRFITQREEHRLALLVVESTRDGFSISNPDGESVLLPRTPEVGERVEVSVWRDTVEAVAGPRHAVDFFSSFLGYSCRPVRMPDDGIRSAGKYAADGTPLSFADAYPGLITSEDSLRDLNTRTDVPIIMRRFRPNVVVSGAAPYAEDGWLDVNIGEVAISLVKPCSRCVLTTVNPDTAVSGKEPLRTLARYRRFENEVYFGQNFAVTKTGVVRIGDPVTVSTRKEPLAFETAPQKSTVT